MVTLIPRLCRTGPFSYMSARIKTVGIMRIQLYEFGICQRPDITAVCLRGRGKQTGKAEKQEGAGNGTILANIHADGQSRLSLPMPTPGAVTPIS